MAARFGCDRLPQFPATLAKVTKKRTNLRSQLRLLN
jgi:hypothetical protein